MTKPPLLVLADEDVQRLLEKTLRINVALMDLRQIDLPDTSERWRTLRASSAALRVASLRACLATGNPIGFISLVYSTVTECSRVEESFREPLAWVTEIRAQAIDLAIDADRTTDPATYENGRLTSDALYELSDSLLRVAPSIEWPDTQGP